MIRTAVDREVITVIKVYGLNNTRSKYIKE